MKVPNVLTDKRQLAVLTDEELVRYLGWQHPEEHYGMAASNASLAARDPPSRTVVAGRRNSQR